jgi:hypothetical protein
MGTVGFMKKIVDQHGERRSGAEELERVQRLEVPHHLHDWIEKQVGKPIEEITLEDLRKLPRRDDLKYAGVTSGLGGRKADHLDHPDPREAAALEERGTRFLEETPDEDLTDEDLDVSSESLSIEHY